MVEMTVQGIGRLEEGGHVAVLRERGGDRTMGVGIGEGAATWVSAHLARLPVPRPNAHLLTLRVIQRLGARLVRVTVDDNGLAAEPSGYLELEADGGICEVGCAPEDAVAVAAYAGVAVMVHPDLLRAHTGPSGDVGAEPPSRKQRRRARPGADPAAGAPNEP